MCVCACVCVCMFGCLAFLTFRLFRVASTAIRFVFTLHYCNLKQKRTIKSLSAFKTMMCKEDMLAVYMLQECERD